MSLHLFPSQARTNGSSITISSSSSQNNGSSSAAPDPLRDFIRDLDLAPLSEEQVADKIRKVKSLDETLRGQATPAADLQICRLNLIVELMQSSLTQTQTDSTKELAAAQNQTKAAKAENEKLKRRLDTSDKENDELRKAPDAIKQGLGVLQSNIYAFRGTLLKSQESEKKATAKAAQLQNQLATQKAEAEKTAQANKQLEEELATLKTKVEDLTSQLSESRRLLKESQRAETKAIQSEQSMLEAFRKAQDIFASVLPTPPVEDSSSESSLDSSIRRSARQKRRAETDAVSNKPKRRNS